MVSSLPEGSVPVEGGGVGVSAPEALRFWCERHTEEYGNDILAPGSLGVRGRFALPLLSWLPRVTGWPHRCWVGTGHETKDVPAADKKAHIVDGGKKRGSEGGL